jgi:3-methyl-2-oxobutanoate hydroxymethyltransferase
MGAWSGHKAKFVRHFANSRELREKAIHNFGEAVRDGSFPDSEAESYSFNKSEWTRFLESEDGDDVQ